MPILLANNCFMLKISGEARNLEHETVIRQQNRHMILTKDAGQGMNNFLDYYALLGVPFNASASDIKSAFKKLALQYHPDVYKGEDAHERMRVLLQAYQTLNDPAERKVYDARRSEFLAGAPVSMPPNRMSRTQHAPAKSSVPTPSARRDRQRYYDFPELYDDRPDRVDLIDIAYSLTTEQVHTLRGQGMLRGMLPESGDGRYFCHRCHHHWSKTVKQTPNLPPACPKCGATNWSEYLLLRCIHCCAVFESEQIRYEIGSYNYAKGAGASAGSLCPPYELFPLCPYCGASHWCPVEDARVDDLRARAARRAMAMRVVLISAVVVLAVVLGSFILGGLH